MAGTLWVAIHGADMKFQGSARIQNRDFEIGKKLDKQSQEHKRDLQELTKAIRELKDLSALKAAKLDTSVCVSGV